MSTRCRVSSPNFRRHRRRSAMAVPDGEYFNQSRSKSSFFLAKSVLKSSVVLQAVFGHIRSPGTLDIVFGKETSLELLVLTDDGVVQSICEQPIFGKIKDLKLLPWNEHYRSSNPQVRGKDLLVLTSDSGKMSFLTFSIELHRFLAITHVQISQSVNSRRDLGQLLAVDSRGRAIAVGAFEDKIAIFPTSIHAGNNIVEKRMAYPKDSRDNGDPTALVGTIWSMTFVASQTNESGIDPDVMILVVLLHRKGAIDNEVIVMISDPRERTIQLKTISDPMGSGSSLSYLVTDVPSMPGFIFVFRNREIELLEISKSGIPLSKSSITLPEISNAVKTIERIGSNGVDEEGRYNEAVSALLELVSRTEDAANSSSPDMMEMASCNGVKDGDPQVPSLICCWSWDIDSSSGLRAIFCMDTGDLYLLKLTQGNSNELKMNLSSCLYQCSPLKSLLWMKGGLIAALTEMGDGQILQIKDEGICSRSIIQNIAPILDFSLADYHGEKQDQMFACCGVGSEGSLRIIRNGVIVEKLTSTPPLYEGVTGCWSMKICREDINHAFLVLSFVEETRVMSVGFSFHDVTDSVGFSSSVCTLACGWIDDGWVTQVCSNEVFVCAPTVEAHPKGIQCVSPISNGWIPTGMKVSLGAVSHMRVILAMSQPGFLVMLGLATTSSGERELTEIQSFQFGAELSCISIPQEEEPDPVPVSATIVGLEPSSAITLPNGVEIGKVFVVGTHKPSVELLSMVPGENFSVLAVGQISFINTTGASIGSSIPEDVRLVLFDRPYILAGLRNGMLLRFEWPQHESLSGFLSSNMVSDKGNPAHENKESVQGPELFVTMPSNAQSILSKLPALQESKLGIGKQNEILFPVQLHLIAIRRVGVSPVSLIPLQASLHADIIALGDRPWLLQTARHTQKIAYTSISFQPSTHATSVRSSECHRGILFVANCSLHLVQMEDSKRLNVQRLPLGSTPRKILFHTESKTLLVMRSEYCEAAYGYVSDICSVDPLSGAVLFSFKFDNCEVPKCMELWKSGNEDLLLVGTGLTTGKAMMANGEPEGAKGRLLVFRLEPKQRTEKNLAFASRSNFTESAILEPSNSNVGACFNVAEDILMEDTDTNNMAFSESDGRQLILKSHVPLSGVVLAVSPYLDQYVLTCAGNTLSCLGFTNDSPHRLKRYDSVRTRFVLTCIAVHLNRIAVGDCRDGILIYSYREDAHKLEQLYCDPSQRIVANTVLIDLETVLVTDRYGNFCALSCPTSLKDCASPERNLIPQCWYHTGEVMMNLCKGSLAYKALEDGNIKISNTNCGESSDFSDSSVIASSILGSVVVFIRISREDYELLDALQSRLAFYPLTAPLLGNNHAQFRGRGCHDGGMKVLDGDMLAQFLELTSSQQQSVLADQPGVESLSSFHLSLATPSQEGLPVERVLRLLERIYNSLT